MRLEELQNRVAEASRVFVLTDENVAPLWLTETLHWLRCKSSVDIVIKSGEQQKSLKNAQRIWKTLTRYHADRSALLINLGGGVVTDLGGFAASTYKRGIPFINIPTTLLGMVDAAIGGKTGIDFNGFKNQLGTFAEPLEVMINPIFLSTLPERELLSGMAEMIKYGFVYDPNMLKVNKENYQNYLLRAGEIKRMIVKDDPFDEGSRKVLNFGHTLGHAIESYCLGTEYPLLHGEAVALGMGAALWLSVEERGLDAKVLQSYEKQLPMLLSKADLSLSEKDEDPILRNLVQDKKNKNGQTRFVLLNGVGEPLWDVAVKLDRVKCSLEYMINKVSAR
jgi:3-dehydroquinate synthase